MSRRTTVNRSCKPAALCVQKNRSLRPIPIYTAVLHRTSYNQCLADFHQVYNPRSTHTDKLTILLNIVCYTAPKFQHSYIQSTQKSIYVSGNFELSSRVKTMKFGWSSLATYQQMRGMVIKTLRCSAFNARIFVLSRVVAKNSTGRVCNTGKFNAICEREAAAAHALGSKVYIWEHRSTWLLALNARLAISFNHNNYDRHSRKSFSSANFSCYSRGGRLKMYT